MSHIFSNVARKTLAAVTASAFLAVPLAGLVPSVAFAATAPGDSSIMDYAVWGGSSASLASSASVKSGLTGSTGSVTTDSNSSATDGIQAGGNITVGSSFKTSGSLISNGKVSVGSNAKVGGDVDAGGTITLGASAHVTGAQNPADGTPLSPVPTLPSVAVCTPGTGSQTISTTNASLPAGSYGAVSINASKKLTLSGAGTYDFQSLSAASNGTLTVDLQSSGQDAYICVANGVNLASSAQIAVKNGDASQVLLVAQNGDITLASNAKSAGTLYATAGNVTLASSAAATGALYASQTVSVGSNATLVFDAAPQFATLATPVPPAPTPSVTTDDATGISATDATLNATDGPVAATQESFWVSTSTIDTSSPNIPAGAYSTPVLPAVGANTAFSDQLSLVTTQGITTGGVPGNMPAITQGTTYYYVAWVNANGSWYPGAVKTVTTTVVAPDPADSKFTANPEYVRANTAGDTAAQALVPAAADSAHFTYTQTDGTNVYTDVVGAEHLQAGQFPVPSTGQHQYRGGVGAAVGTYTVTGEFEIAGTWYPITGSATVYSLGNPTGSFVFPSTAANVFRPSDNPARISAGDANDTFRDVVFNIDGTNYQVNRASCDLREAGSRVLCDVSSAANWTGNLADGSHTVSATVYDLASNHTAVASESFTVDSSLPVVTNFLITPPAASYGSSIAVSADATDAVSGIQSVDFFITAPRAADGVCDGNGTVLADGSVTTPTSGDTYGTMLDTSALTGTYCVNVVAENLAAGHSAVQEITAAFGAVSLAAPTLASPANGSTSTSADLASVSWNPTTDSVGGITYVYQSSNTDTTNPDGSFASPAYTSSPLTDTSISTLNTPDGTYYWHVQATDADGNVSAWSDIWSFIVDSTVTPPPLVLTLLSPDNGTTVNASDFSFSWSPFATATPVTYEWEGSLAADTNPDGSFASPVADHTGLTDTSLDSPSTPDGTYYWHVRATDGSGDMSAWSDTWSVTVDTSSGSGGTPTDTTSTTTVQEADLAPDLATAAASGDWFFYNDQTNTLDNTLGSFVDGPDTAPAGDGSAQISATAGEGIVLGTSVYAGTPLADIASLSYSTYRSEGDPAVDLALQFDVDKDTTDVDTSYQGRLVYEPYFTHTVLDNTWQTWNPMDNATSGVEGNWWFSNGNLSNASACSQLKPCTWAQVLAAFPNIGISGGTFFKAGTWNGDFTGNVDDFAIGLKSGVDTATTVYDFEPTDTPPLTFTSNFSAGGNGLTVPPPTPPSTPTPSDDNGGNGTSTPPTTDNGGGEVLGASTYNFTKNLWYHMKSNDDVAQLQNFLIAEGYLIPDAVTQFFGSQTLAAVKAFQKANNLPTTGYVGALTRAILDQGIIPTTPEGN